MSKEKTVEEKRAALILKYRNLKIDKEEREGDNITYYLSRGEQKFVMLCSFDATRLRHLRSRDSLQGQDSER
jgi:hypothetical protein